MSQKAKVYANSDIMVSASPGVGNTGLLME
jgi:hypothetical protein